MISESDSYDVIIIGGAIYGSSVAWFLTQEPDFDGRILVIEKDPTYANASTSHTNSCIRQQFSNPLNIQISQFGAEFYTNLRQHMGDDPRVPDLRIQNFGYMYLANTESFAETLRQNQKVQLEHGARTELLTPSQIKERYPFYTVDDLVLGSINTHQEGYFEGSTMFDWWKKSAREHGVEYLHAEVTGLEMNAAGTRVEAVVLDSGKRIACGTVVAATGARAAQTAQMAGINIPVEPRKRFTWVFTAETPLDRDLPLTIDPSGAHVRQDGKTSYLAGGHADHDPPVDHDDFEMDNNVWLEKVWPAIAARIPQFEAIRVTSEWAGHYDFNVLDHNAIIGPHPKVSNYLFLGGFSGHGLQQSPALGRGTAEWITHGEFRSLDLSPFKYDRIAKGTAFSEQAVI